MDPTRALKVENINGKAVAKRGRTRVKAAIAVNNKTALEILARESDPTEREQWRSLANGARLTIPLLTVVGLEAAGLIERLRCDGKLVRVTDRRGHVRLTEAGWQAVTLPTT